LRNVEKRKVAPLGKGGLCYTFLPTGYAAGVKIPNLKTLKPFPNICHSHLIKI